MPGQASFIHPAATASAVAEASTWVAADSACQDATVPKIYQAEEEEVRLIRTFQGGEEEVRLIRTFQGEEEEVHLIRTFQGEEEEVSVDGRLVLVRDHGRLVLARDLGRLVRDLGRLGRTGGRMALAEVGGIPTGDIRTDRTGTPALRTPATPLCLTPRAMCVTRHSATA